MRLMAILMAALTLVSCSQKNSDTAAEAKAAFGTYVKALNDGDINLAVAMYDDEIGFHWIERGEVQYDKGADAAASLKALSQSGGKAMMTADNVRVAAMENGSALVSAHFDYAMLDEEGEQQFAFDGWMTVGMVKRADGWKIAGGQTGPGKAAE